MIPRAEGRKICFSNSKQFNITGLETPVTNIYFEKLPNISHNSVLVETR